MKRTVAFILFAAMIIGVFIPVTAFAESPEDYADNLVAYWNFESDKPLDDKGTGSLKNNNLTATGSGVSYSGGVGTVSNEAGNYFMVTMHKGYDLDQSAALTLGFKMKLDKVKESDTVILRRTNAYQITASNNKDTGTYSLKWINDALPNQSVCVYSIFGDTSFDYGQEYYFFIVVEAATATIEGVSKQVNDITGYYSVDGENFTSNRVESTQHYYTNVESGYVFRSGCNGTPIQIGKINDTGAMGAILSFDDIWYFNTAVSAESLSTIALHRMHHSGSTETGVPAYRGCQVPAVDTETERFGVRFVGTVDSTDYAGVGFEITVTDYNGVSGDMKVYTTDTVYSSIIGSTDVGGTVTYSAADLGGTYIFALSVNNIPTTYSATFLVTPFHIAVGTSERVTGTPYSVTVFNGNVVSQNQVIA